MSKNKQALGGTSEQSDDSSSFYRTPSSTSSFTSRFRRTLERALQGCMTAYTTGEKSNRNAGATIKTMRMNSYACCNNFVKETKYCCLP